MYHAQTNIVKVRNKRTIWLLKWKGSVLEQGCTWVCGIQLWLRTRGQLSISSVCISGRGNWANGIPTTYGGVAMAVSAHCECGISLITYASCTVSCRALLCSFPPSTLKVKRNTPTHTVDTTTTANNILAKYAHSMVWESEHWND